MSCLSGKSRLRLHSNSTSTSSARKYAHLKEYCEGRFGYFDALVSDSIHEFRVDRFDVNRRVDGIQDLIDQYKLDGCVGRRRLQRCRSMGS